MGQRLTANIVKDSVRRMSAVRQRALPGVSHPTTIPPDSSGKHDLPARRRQWNEEIILAESLVNEILALIRNLFP